MNRDKKYLLTLGTSERLQALTEELEVFIDNVKLEETEGKGNGIKMQSNLKWSEQRFSIYLQGSGTG